MGLSLISHCWAHLGTSGHMAYASSSLSAGAREGMRGGRGSQKIKHPRFLSRPLVLYHSAALNLESLGNIHIVVWQWPSKHICVTRLYTMYGPTCLARGEGGEGGVGGSQEFSQEPGHVSPRPVRLNKNTKYQTFSTESSGTCQSNRAGEKRTPGYKGAVFLWVSAVTQMSIYS